jgi:hypothetical protein
LFAFCGQSAKGTSLMSLLLLMGGSAPNVASLFANNEAGLALDVEAAYLRGWVYQDSAGATVAAAAGDPVGLILDTAKGGLDQLGGDLVSNGTFASDTVWTKGANWTIGSGVATKTGGAANNLTQTISSTAGLWYRITMDVTRTAGTLTVSLGTSGTTYAMSASGSYTFFILAGSSTQTLTLAGDSSFAGTVDNVTARLVPGNHAYQTTSGSRPALARTPDGGRRNLLTYSESLSNAAWQPSTISNGTSVNGVISLSNSEGYAYVTQGITGNTSVDHVVSFDVTCDQTIANVPIRCAGSVNVSTLANLTAGVTTRITITGYRPSATNFFIGLDARDAVVPGGSNSTGYSVTFNRVQLEVGSSATAYQKVGLTSDVTESGKRDCWGLLFDGSDDSLQTASVDFSATDKMTVMAGVRKLSDAASAALTELSTDAGSVNGTFAVYAPRTANNAVEYRSRGSATITVTEGNVSPAPITLVFTGLSDISGDSVTVRKNGVVANTNTGDQGSGNYSNNILYIGRRGGSTLPFNGILYTLIVRGATTPTSTIADFERNLLAKRAGISW